MPAKKSKQEDKSIFRKSPKEQIIAHDKRRIDSTTTPKEIVPKVFRSDPKQTAALEKVGRAGTAKAIRESMALGLSITFLKKGVLYKEHPDGRIEIVKPAPKQKKLKASMPLKKGMIFHAKK